MRRFYPNCIYAIYFVLYLCTSYSYAQIDPTPQGNYTIQDYDITDGLRQMQVNKVFVSSRGEVWVGTRSGVCTFNNGEFDTFDDLKVKPNYVADIKELSDGTIVILAQSSLFYFDGSKFSERKLLSESRYTFRANISIENDNRLLIKNFFDFDGIVVEPDTIINFDDYFPHLDISKARSIIPYDDDGKYLVLTTDGVINLCSADIDSCKQIYKSSKSIISLYEGTRVSNCDNKNKDNSLVFFEHLKYQKHQLVLMNKNELKFDTLYYDNKINNNDIEQGESVLLKINQGIVLLRDSASQVIIQDYKTPYHNVLSMCTHDDKYYLGTDKGLVIISESKFRNYNGELHENIWTICETPDKKILLGSYSKGLKYLGQDSLIRFSSDKSLSERENQFLKNAKRAYYFGSVTDKNGHIYLSHQDGMFKFVEGSVQNFYPKKDIQKESPTLISYYDSSHHHILRGTCPGVDFIDLEGNLIRKIDTTLFAHNCILTINKTADNYYWFGATGGIAKYDYEEDTIYNYRYSEEKVPHYTVISSLVDDNNNLWIGGKGGLSYYNPELDSFMIIEELRNYEVASIIQAAPDKYFLATIRGLLMVDLKAYLDDGVMRSRLFTSDDGMQGLELGQNGFFRDSKDHIWITSATNVLSFNPADLEYHSDELSPQIQRINDIRVGYNNSPIALEKGENTVTIDYKLSNSNYDKDIRYRHRINNDKWSKWTNSHVAQFSSLGSGDYTFEVECKSIINKDLKSESCKSHFQVNVPFHKEPFFNKVLGLLLLSLLIVTFLLFRNRQLKLEIVNLLEKEKNQLIFEKKELESINRKLKRKMLEVQSLTTKSENNQNEILEIKVLDKIHKVQLSDILYAISEDSGVRIKTLHNSLWTQVSMKTFLMSLSDEGFIRIHRSNVVNVRHIKWVNHVSLMMNDNTELKIGRTYKDTILKSFG